MLTRCLIRAQLVAAALLCASVLHAAVVTPIPKDTTVKLMRGSSAMTTDPRNGASLSGASSVLTPENCATIRDGIIEHDGLTREAGANVYKCVLEQRAMVTFKANACAPLPAPVGRVVQCPPGTVGAFTQTKSWSTAPNPACAIEGEWTPATPTALQCPPLDTDSDGVPDSTDRCPTVPSTEPDGCPATPPANQAPTISGVLLNSAVGADYYFLPRASDPEGDALTFSLANAPSWMVFRASDGRIVGRATAAGTHANIVVSVRDSAGNVTSLPPATITITGSSAPPVNCAVSAWSAWSAGAWSACANGQQSRTETRTRTVVTPASNGGTACPALSETRTATQACAPIVETASLSWTPPTQNTDGTSLINLAGYRIAYGSTPDALVHTVQIANPGASRYTINNLSPGTYYFAVRAYTSNGTESANSNVSSKTVR